MKYKRGISAMLAVAMLFATNAYGEETKATQETTLYIAGDSTACIYGSDDNYALPRGGWGMYLEEFMDNAKVVDLAKSGRSSKSFTVEEEYKELMDSLGEGDYLLIQFGHNDAKKSSQEDLENRYTDPTGDKDTEGSFKHSLYTNYILPAMEKGATPVLLTPVSRNKFDENGEVSDSHGLYDDAIRELAGELSLPYVDMTAATRELYNSLGAEKAKNFHAIFKDVEKGEKGFDNTHYNRYGARLIAAMTALRIESVYGGEPGLGNYVNEAAINNLINATTTRGEFTAKVVRLLGIEPKEGESFKDVSPDYEYASAIAAAMEAGIISGNENGEFMPDNELTVQDMAVITNRALRYVKVLDGTSTTELPDNIQVKEYALPPMTELLEEGILDMELLTENGEVVATTPAGIDLQADVIARSFERYTDLLEIASTGDMSLDELEKVE